MDMRDWKPVIVAPNKFEARLLVDLLRNAGVPDACVFSDPQMALDGASMSRANMLFLTEDGERSLEWVRQLRRANAHPLRKAPVFVVSAALTLALAERCRIAGVNAIIGKPISSASLMNTIKKVLAKPRPFVESASYVGPCRRAGIVTAGVVERRRSNDVGSART